MGSIHKQDSGGDEEDFAFAMQLASNSMLSMATQVAVELNVFEIIAKAGPGAQLSPRDIISQLPTQNPQAADMLDRILRLMASHSMLTATAVERPDGIVERLYGLASVCRYFVSDEDGVSLSPFLRPLPRDVIETHSCWFHLMDAILEGGVPTEKARGMHEFECAELDPAINCYFNKAMFNHTTIVMRKILKTYKGFEDLKTVVDVGGGIGTTISMITSNYCTIKGINFDLPHVIRVAPSYHGVEHVEGNMFETVPNGEAICLKWILHDWDDEHCLKLLKNCYKALPDNGKVIVVEGILPVAVETDNAAKGLCQLDTVMLTTTQGGKERTEKEYEGLAKEAGFAYMKKICCVYNFWVMEFYKK